MQLDLITEEDIKSFFYRLLQTPTKSNLKILAQNFITFCQDVVDNKETGNYSLLITRLKGLQKRVDFQEYHTLITVLITAIDVKEKEIPLKAVLANFYNLPDFISQLEDIFTHAGNFVPQDQAAWKATLKRAVHHSNISHPAYYEKIKMSNFGEEQDDEYDIHIKMSLVEAHMGHAICLEEQSEALAQDETLKKRELLKQAIPHYEKVFDILDDRIKNNKSISYSDMENLIHCVGNGLGWVYSKIGEFKKAIDLQKAMIERLKTETIYQDKIHLFVNARYYLANMYYHYMLHLIAKNKPEFAQLLAYLAIEILREDSKFLTGEEYVVPEMNRILNRRLISYIKMNLAEKVFIPLGNLEKASELYRQTKRHLVAILEYYSHPDNAHSIFKFLSKNLSQNESRALESCTQLFNKVEGNIKQVSMVIKMQRVKDLCQKAAMLEEAGESKEASHLMIKEIAIRHEIAKEFPDQIYYSHLLSSYGRLASCYLDQNQISEAIQAWEDIFKILLERGYDRNPTDVLDMEMTLIRDPMNCLIQRNQLDNAIQMGWRMMKLIIHQPKHTVSCKLYIRVRLKLCEIYQQNSRYYYTEERYLNAIKFKEEEIKLYDEIITAINAVSDDALLKDARKKVETALRDAQFDLKTYYYHEIGFLNNRKEYKDVLFYADLFCEGLDNLEEKLNDDQKERLAFYEEEITNCYLAAEKFLSSSGYKENCFFQEAKAMSSPPFQDEEVKENGTKNPYTPSG